MGTEQPAIWQEPPRGTVVDTQAMMRMSGLEQMRHPAMGPPPMGRLTGMEFVSADPSRAVFAMPLTGWLQWSGGEIPGGVLCLPADAAAGCALQTELGPETAYTTAELSMTYLRAVDPGDRVTADGRCLHAGASLGLSDVRVTDSSGRLVAHGTSRATIFPPAHDLSGRVGGTVPPPRAPVVDGADTTSADPWQRPVAGTVVDGESARRSGRERLEGLISGELPLPPLHHLLGITPVAAGDGRATVTMPATGWLATPWGWPQGGFVALIADGALGMAVETLLPVGGRMRTVDLKVNFVRPVAGDGELLTATGLVVHRGRRLAIATAEVRDSRDRIVALATGSSALLSDR